MGKSPRHGGGKIRNIDRKIGDQDRAGLEETLFDFAPGCGQGVHPKSAEKSQLVGLASSAGSSLVSAGQEATPPASSFHQSQDGSLGPSQISPATIGTKRSLKKNEAPRPPGPQAEHGCVPHDGR